MNQTEVRNFVEAYFLARESKFLEREASHITVELPKEVDKDLGNRPFYWSYVEKVGIEPQPLVLTLVFDRDRFPNHVRAEEIRFGSQRLSQIIASARKRGRFTRMYEHERGRELSPLTPWLNLNYSISYICDKKKDRLASFGINLISGEIKEDFFHALQQRCLVKKLPHYQFVKQPHIPLPDAVKKTQRHVKNVLADEDQAWAREAETRLREEQDILRAYYRDEENEEEQRRRMQELEWQYRPQIDVQLVNAGLFYLT